MPAKPTTTTNVIFEKGKVAFQRGWAGMGVVLNIFMAKMLWPLYRWMQSTIFTTKKLRDGRRKSLRKKNNEGEEEDKRGSLHVIMKGAQNLPVTDLHGSSDAFGWSPNIHTFTQTDNSFTTAFGRMLAEWDLPC
jgi:hypothetical protein